MKTIRELEEQIRERRDLFDDEVWVTVVSSLGIHQGQFVTTKYTLPQLVVINKSPDGQSYFRWEGIKEEERM